MSASTRSFRQARDLLFDLRDDLDQARALFRWPVLTDFNWALDWFDTELGGGVGDKPALKIVGDSEAERSFRSLSEASNRVANGLRDLGVKKGDRLLLMLGNCAALWEVMLAAMKVGAVTVPTTTLCTRDDVKMRLEQSGARFLVASGSRSAELEDLAKEVTKIAIDRAPAGWVDYSIFRDADGEFRPRDLTSADDPLLLYFTSGTTARPKLVVHSHRSYGAGSLSTMYWLGLRPNDLHLNVSSPGWAKHAWSCFFAPWNAAAAIFIANQERFSAPDLLRSIVEHRVDSLCAPPTVWRMLIQEDLGSHAVSLRSACSAGEPLNPEVIDAVAKAWKITIRDGFGQTETTAQIANTPGQKVKPGAVGRPLPGYDVVLLDAEGQEAAEGEIALKLDPAPAGLMRGYIADDGRLEPIGGEYYRTGDVASRDSEGWFTYVGRADDVFKASDYRLSPFELESALIEHPAVMEAAVVPAPDPLRLAVPKAYVTVAAGQAPGAALALDIFRHIGRSLAPYKRIRRVEFGALPKTISGKIRRVELRRREVDLYARRERPQDEYREEDFPDLKTERERAK